MHDASSYRRWNTRPHVVVTTRHMDIAVRALATRDTGINKIVLAGIATAYLDAMAQEIGSRAAAGDIISAITEELTRAVH